MEKHRGQFKNGRTCVVTYKINPTKKQKILMQRWHKTARKGFYGKA